MTDVVKPKRRRREKVFGLIEGDFTVELKCYRQGNLWSVEKAIFAVAHTLGMRMSLIPESDRWDFYDRVGDAIGRGIEIGKEKGLAQNTIPVHAESETRH